MKTNTLITCRKYQAAIDEMIERYPNGITNSQAHEISSRLQTNNAILSLLKKMGMAVIMEDGRYVLNRNIKAMKVIEFNRHYANKYKKKSDAVNGLPPLNLTGTKITDEYCINYLKKTGKYKILQLVNEYKEI